LISRHLPLSLLPADKARASMATATPTLKFTIGQYDLMIEAGVFARPPAPGEPLLEPPRVELIEGEIVMMSPIGSRHEEIVDRLTAWSFRCLPQDAARVRIQQSLGVPGRHSVPQPDVAWVQSRDYAAKRPGAADALLVIEVAETSLSYDLGEKAAIYAAGDVADYWVVDVAAEIVHVLRRPGPLAYAEHRVAGRGESLTPLARPEATLAVDSLFAARS
jgi:Uma2 family endonuclease